MNLKLLTLSFSLLLLNSSHAYAAGTITPNTSTPGDIQNEDDGGSTVGFFEAGLSYCCNFISNAGGAVILEVSSDISVGSNPNIVGIDRATTSPALGINAVLNTTKGNRLCFIPENTAQHAFTFTDLSQNGMAIETQCNETTLFGGYNTNANPFNFLEISNTTNSNISGKIFATNFDGTVVIDGAPFTVNAQNRIDISIHDAAGPNVFGLIKIVHDGPLGSLLANTSYYSGPVSALELKGTVPAAIRDRR